MLPGQPEQGDDAFRRQVRLHVVGRAEQVPAPFCHLADPQPDFPFRVIAAPEPRVLHVPPAAEADPVPIVLFNPRRIHVGERLYRVQDIDAYFDQVFDEATIAKYIREQDKHDQAMAERAGYLSPEMVFVDATHIKANANIKKKCKKEIPQTARQYEQQLREEINACREEHGQQPFDASPQSGKTRQITQSVTDPESGLFRKGEPKMCFAYGAHTVCDRNTSF
jgi:hypothetical protein